MKNYQEASKKLTGRCKNRRKLANNTYLERRENDIAVKLHDTDIITYHSDGTTTLNSGGWRTVTTKDRINRYSSTWLQQVNSVWLVADRYLFQDNMKVDECGQPLFGILNSKLDRQATNKLKKRIKVFAELCSENCVGIRPGNGDCLLCRCDMKGNDHLESHMDEPYPVPSLIYKACERFGASKATMSVLYHGDPSGHMIDQAKDSVKRVVRRYMYEQFGLAS